LTEHHKVVGHDEWVEARKALLIEEKEFTRLRDELSRRRRDLPWEAVGEEYVFDGPNGKQTLAELFDGRSQLIVYHFMFDPAWDEGCPHCSFWADSFDANVVHPNARDVMMVAVSRAPFAKLAAYEQRMGWSFGFPRRWRAIHLRRPPAQPGRSGLRLQAGMRDWSPRRPTTSRPCV
jgi:predicted dithiol-disulfide oxidoreductase (DUF899 family)